MPKASSQLLSHPWCCQACGHFPQPPDHEDPSELACGAQNLQATGISGFAFQLEELLEGKEKSKRQCGGDGADAGVGILL